MGRIKMIFVGVVLCLIASTLYCVGGQACDLSFVVLDLKYNSEQGIKICEIQSGSMSVFKSNQYGNHGGREIVENFLKLASNYWQSDLLLSSELCDPTIKQRGPDYGWKVASVDELLKMAYKPKSSVSVSREHLKQYRGAVLARLRRPDDIERLERAFPDHLVVDKATALPLNDKISVDKLLRTDAAWSKLRPRCAVFPRRYQKDLAKKIVESLRSDIVVIKPPNSTKGQGVIIVHQKDLDATLRYLFSSDARLLGQNQDLSYAYWGLRHPRYFIVEEFVASDPVAIPLMKGALFDPTLRVVVGLVAEGDKVEVHYLGKYWKFPLKNINGEGPLNASHKSNGDHPYACEVEERVWHKVQDLLRPPLENIYRKLLSEGR